MTPQEAADQTDIDPTVPPSGTGCSECLDAGGWWVHLRRCAACGHVGCCDTSPAQHATAHFQATGHPIIRSFEPGEGWYFDYRTSRMANGSRARAARLPPGDPAGAGA